ncbi:MAG: hypothetical protein ACI9PX_000204 [Reinekea sp.]
MVLAGTGAFFKLRELFVQQLINLNIGALVETFSTHKNNIEVWQLMLMQAQVVASDPLYAISFDRALDILFRNNKSQTRLVLLIKSREQQTEIGWRLDVNLVKYCSKIGGCQQAQRARISERYLHLALDRQQCLGAQQSTTACTATGD